MKYTAECGMRYGTLLIRYRLHWGKINNQLTGIRSQDTGIGIILMNDYVGIAIVVSLFAIAAGIIIYFKIKTARRKARRKEILHKLFSAEWDEILKKNLPPYTVLPSELRKELQGFIQIFIDEKTFEGCGGIELNNEIRVTIAAQACLLLLNRQSDCYPRLKTVLVYPGAYFDQHHDDLASSGVRLGESWGSGIVVLSWDHVKGGAVNFRDGHNVAIHEFAHQLDQEDGVSDGTPCLENRSAYSGWARVLSRDYETLRKKAGKGRKSVMDKYGATNPAEFFAVATETFFEKPRQLHKKHPDLYQELKEYYKMDPLGWQ
ncbi:zinc-dependent peptidase [Planctomycetota bacterium]